LGNSYLRVQVFQVSPEVPSPATRFSPPHRLLKDLAVPDELVEAHWVRWPVARLLVLIDPSTKLVHIPEPHLCAGPGYLLKPPHAILAEGSAYGSLGSFICGFSNSISALHNVPPYGNSYFYLRPIQQPLLRTGSFACGLFAEQGS
jgi:hypothetical protein